MEGGHRIYVPNVQRCIQFCASVNRQSSKVPVFPTLLFHVGAQEGHRSHLKGSMRQSLFAKIDPHDNSSSRR